MRSLMIPLLLLLGGCTAARGGYNLLNATRAYEEAVTAGGEVRAPYEITMAREYLQKAKEENGYSSYGAVEDLCKESMKFSQTALSKAQTEAPETPLDLPLDDSKLEDR